MTIEVIFRLQLVLILLFAVRVNPVAAQSTQIEFAVNVQGEDTREGIGVRGDIKPLSWEKTFFLQDEDGDGIFTGSLTIESDQKILQYKFVKNDSEYELQGDDNRLLKLDQGAIQVMANFNVFNPLPLEELAQIRFSPEAVKEDIAVLKEALYTIHPNLYRYIDSLALVAAFGELQTQMLAENDLPAAFKYITQFLARLQCSHTITNPWNQSRLIKRALFYQKDKLPFTFKVLNNKILIEKNASEEPRLSAGVEVLAINGIPTSEILERLFPYISADGNNDAKRWYSLGLNGTEKFEAFDIIFPMEFEIAERVELQLRDHRAGQTFTTQIATTSKSERSAVLQNRYPEMAANDDELWQFEMINDQVAYLKLGTFVTWHMTMDWKKFLTDAFNTISDRSVPNLIIDIRDNSGGMDEVYAFILERLIREPISMHTPASKIAYQRIPKTLRPYIGTWDDSAFDWNKQVEPQPDGYFLSKPVAGRSRKFKGKKDGYRGQTYLITNAANSSATHLMATYTKKYQLGTLVGGTTGGNQQGINGGMIFFTRLPNTGVEVDIPIFGTYTPPGTPNGGIVPDIPVAWTVEDVIAGRDPDIEAILARIEQ